MWYKLGLRGRIYLILSVLMLITLTGGVVMIRYAYRMETLLTLIIDRDLGAFQTAEAMETALVNQKGSVSYYFLDKDPNWLRQLGEYRQLFREHLGKAFSVADSKEQHDVLTQIESEYIAYVRDKDQVIAYYNTGKIQAGAALHRSVREVFFKLLTLCESYKNIHRKRILEISRESRKEAGYLRLIGAMAMSMSFFLIFLLALVFVNHILEPVRQLTQEVHGKKDFQRSDNEIRALSQSVRHLIEDADQTHSELEKSREHLQQAEKMAMVGKLAAGMAHSIRNPFTSVKMRLFSLSRSLKMSDPQKEDFEVISQEIRHVDTIVQNFLEFSRPPRLKMQRISPSVIADMAIQLLEHRLNSYNVSMKVIRKEIMPEIMGDPEQLKEVLVNLIVNACEAMENNGGQIIIKEAAIAEQQVAVIRISDNGPGIPQAIREKIFQPFFTTKEEGTGLGLSIATRIIEEHKGRLEADSQEGKGTTFIITLPVSL